MDKGIIIIAFFIALAIGLVVLAIISQILTNKEELRKEKEMFQKEKNKLETLNIEKTKIIKGKGYCLVFDDVNNKFAITTDKYSEFYIYRYSDFIECQVIENGGQVHKKKSNAGKVILGSLFFGTAGAIAGMSGAKKTTTENVLYSLSVRILVKNLQNPFYQIDFIDRECEVGSEVYNRVTKKVTEIITTFNLIKEKSNKDSKKA